MTSFRDYFRNRHLRNRIGNPRDEYWDRKLNVKTFGFHPGSSVDGVENANMPFVPSAYADIFQYLRAVSLNAEDVFVDLGCGYGRTVFAASWLGARKAIGVDLVRPLIDGAELNRQNSRLKGRDVRFICANALEFSEPEMTVLYMFHPFGEPILEQVLANIHDTRTKSPAAKKLRIIYANPVYDGALERAGWLRKTAHIMPAKRSFTSIGRFETALWESI